MSGMRSLFAVALVAAIVTLPAGAQRGGSRGGAVGHSAGFASHSSGFGGSSSPAFHSSIAPMGRVGFMGSPQFSSQFRSGQFSSNRYVGILPRPPIPVRAPVTSYPNRSSGYPGRRLDDRYRRPYIPAYGIGLPYGVAVWPGYWDSSYYDDSSYDNSAYATQPAPADYGPEPYPASPVEQAEAAPYRRAYQRPQPEPEPENPVTLVFKDGRPSEQIHDYILTRTTLYVQDTRRHEIPVTDLDLAAMEKVNKAAGVDFQLPGTSR
jgi:hypothetical protein